MNMKTPIAILLIFSAVFANAQVVTNTPDDAIPAMLKNGMTGQEVHNIPGVDDRRKETNYPSLVQFDAQLLEWDGKIAKEEDAIIKVYRKSDKAMCAWQAAKEAVRLKAYDKAAGYLVIMRDFGQSWIGENGDLQGKLLKKLMDAPASIPVRLEFANKFWIDVVPALGPDIPEGRKMMIEALDLNPTDEQKLDIYRKVYKYSISINDTGVVTEYVGRICEDFAANPDVRAGAMYELGRYYAWISEHKKAIETFENILGFQPDGSISGAVHLELAGAYSSLKDEASMLKHLEIAAKSDNRDAAVERLGRYYLDKKEFAKALEYFRSWEAGRHAGCGNCAVEIASERDLYIAQCLVGLGKQDQALKENLIPNLTNNSSMFYSGKAIPQMVVEIYQSRNDLDGFIKFIKPYAAGRDNRNASIALGLAEIRAAGRDGKIDELVKRLRHSGNYVPSIRPPYYDIWEAPEAAEALSAQGGKEYPALLNRFNELAKQKDDGAYGDRIWVLYAIGLSKAPEAKVFIEDLLKKKDQNYHGLWLQYGVNVDDVRYVAFLRKDVKEPDVAGAVKYISEKYPGATPHKLDDGRSVGVVWESGAEKVFEELRDKVKKDYGVDVVLGAIE